MEAYRHFEHGRVFTPGGVGRFRRVQDIAEADFRIVRRELLFDDRSNLLGIDFFADRLPRLYEWHFAWVFSAWQFCGLVETLR